MKKGFTLFFAALVSVLFFACEKSDDAAGGSTPIKFEDEAFEYALVHYLDFDKDGDNQISEQEAAAVYVLDLSSMDKIKSIDGLKYFTSLTSLDCSDTSITSLDVSSNVNLQKLSAVRTEVPSFDLTNNKLLTELNLHRTPIKVLDVSKNDKLTSLNIGGTDITAIDLKNNTSLASISIDSTEFTTFDPTEFKSLTNLYINSTKISSIEFSEENNGSINVLYITDTPITMIDVSNCGKLLDFRINDSLEDLYYNSRKQSYGAWTIPKNTETTDRGDSSENFGNSNTGLAD